MKNSIPIPVAAGVVIVVLVIIGFFLYQRNFTTQAEPPVVNSHPTITSKPENLGSMSKEEAMKKFRPGAASGGQ